MYAKIIDDKIKSVCVGDGTNVEFYKSIGMVDMEVEQAYNGQWYVKGYAPSQPLDELKAQKLTEIDQWTATKITGGFTSNASGELVRYDSDKDTQLTMQGIALNVNTDRFADEYPNGCPVRGVKDGDTEKSVQLLSAEQVLAWCADLFVHIGNCKQEGWAKQNLVNKATTKEELDLIEL